MASALNATAAPPPPAAGTAPAYWNSALRHLRRVDPTMAAIIARHPRIRLESRGDCFFTLARSIVGQQISTKAANSVWARLHERCEGVSPEAVLRRRAASLRACGLSGRKVEYLRDLARHVARGTVDPGLLASQDDEQVIRALTDIRGIGRWTAEMFLIFNLLRPDVLPLDDLGVLKAVGQHYLDGEPASALLRGAGREKVARIGARWAPYRSAATWYLWRSLDPVPVEF